jgi:xanthine/CO dehydrogenase XdhC/CoxF family maturation factor
MKYTARFRLYEELRGWSLEGKSVALATVVSVRGPKLVETGTSLAITSGGERRGSLRTKRVDREIFQRLIQVLRTGQPTLFHLTFAETTRTSAGVAYGTTIEIFAERYCYNLTAHAMYSLMTGDQPLVTAQAVYPACRCRKSYSGPQDARCWGYGSSY